jgi:3-keto-disaccharide hydrolase
MRTRIAVVGLLLVAVCALADDKGVSVSFRKDDLDKTPTGWKAAQTGKGASVWKIVADESAPSKTGLALAQTTADGSATFNLCVCEAVRLKDVEASVAFKAIKGEKDQGGGIVWRYQDADNYYVARMNPLEDNFRVYKVVNGRRSKEFQSAEVKVPAGEWHTLKIKHVGERIECFLDGKKYLDATDNAIAKEGQVGLWTKADAQTRFDRFTVAGK